MLPVCTRMFTRMYSYVTRMYSYVTRIYSHVTRMYSCGVLDTIVAASSEAGERE